MIHALFADLILLLHLALVAFFVFMAPLIFIGGRRGWQWVRMPWLRLVHLAGLCVVAALAWVSVVCPLTTLEMWLRREGGQAGYTGDFIAHWLQAILFWELPPWVFIAAYSLFTLMVAWLWYRVPPQRRVRGDSRQCGDTLCKRG